ncbi:diguanylate cyclase domain-containing protein [Thioalkalivibrio sp. ALJ16]|uniref:diguanylate cyclase domain-containing protein n=1 Tax=Thioalkalivibrio sp. ALJ16 TaxID=1158762 RepID=UPI000366E38C|nr:diguanylate cyclase [Thioalkalivibrio sp. ALJ16]
MPALAEAASESAASGEERLVLGVLAHRGQEAARNQWGPFVEYLTEQVEGARFELEAVDNDDLQAAVSEGRFDLILTNSGSYVMLEQRHGISRIATMQPMQVGRDEDRFGAVVVARADRDDLVELRDLRGQRLSAVHPDAFGGWWMTWRELQAAGLDVERDLGALVFTGFPVSRGLDWVIEGEVDAATFRTGILEDLAARGDPRVDQVRVVGERAIPAFSHRSSTRLYPEWPLAMRGDLDTELAHAILLATLALDAQHPVSRAAGIGGWAAPRSYEDVHALMHELGVGLYAPQPFEILAWLRAHLVWLVSALALLAVLALLYVSRVHARVRRSGRNLERSMDAMPDAVVTLDAHGGISYMNPAARELAGLTRDQVLGCSLDQLLDLRELGSDQPLLPAGARGEGLEQALGDRREARLVRRGGHELIVRIARTGLDPVLGSSVRTVLVVTDVSEERKLVDRLVHEASHDGLTGLLNRRAFERELEIAMHAARENRAVSSLLLVDLDYFKDVNDRHGHRVGDELLRQVAHVLRQLTRGHDAVARIGGDEFAIIARDSNAEYARILGQRICSALADRPLQVEARDVTIGASVGVVELGADVPGVDEAFVAADRACYQAKHRGRGQVGIARKSDIHPITGA